MNNRGHKFGGNWTEEKLECVSKYLHSYTQIMKEREYHFTYIDAFAGTGYRELKNSEDIEIPSFLAGSARKALEVRHPFKEYIFIEEEKNSYTELKNLTNEFPNHNIGCINANANQYLTDLCRERDWRTNRALVFLDPYGMQVEWQTIESIAKTQAIDLWILFLIGMGVSRLLRNDGKIPLTERQTLDEFFGRDDWFDEFYQLARQRSLFNEEDELEKRDNILAEIEQYFLKCLDSVFAMVAKNPLPLRNSKNSLMYLLCFAAGNPNAPKALKIAEEILEKMRNPSQPTLPI
ncbi:MAG: three-Cys-motif partner protein TcmP [Candidatus Poribacteria bacterium]|nr:three-Cys-motif partner protein TcmP [Candidatus Poribacteria bacterium]